MNQVVCWHQVRSLPLVLRGSYPSGKRSVNAPSSNPGSKPPRNIAGFSHRETGHWGFLCPGSNFICCACTGSVGLYLKNRALSAAGYKSYVRVIHMCMGVHWAILPSFVLGSPLPHSHIPYQIDTREIPPIPLHHYYSIFDCSPYALLFIPMTYSIHNWRLYLRLPFSHFVPPGHLAIIILFSVFIVLILLVFLLIFF